MSVLGVGQVLATWGQFTCHQWGVCTTTLPVAMAAELSFVSAFSEPDCPATQINARYQYL